MISPMTKKGYVSAHVLTDARDAEVPPREAGQCKEEIRAGSSLLYLYGCSYINMATFFLVQKCLYAVELQLQTLEHF